MFDKPTALPGGERFCLEGAGAKFLLEMRVCQSLSVLHLWEGHGGEGLDSSKGPQPQLGLGRALRNNPVSVDELLSLIPITPLIQ